MVRAPAPLGRSGTSLRHPAPRAALRLFSLTQAESEKEGSKEVLRLTPKCKTAERLAETGANVVLENTRGGARRKREQAVF